ncbi:hypothetical protein NITLEN_80161 [Nitrospira lenta]|uniref:Uncharacterized protein n=1 Tax=Nitrospira lenta TaxID=1436998 RepID=A0A330LCM9_9BACT|nr:hypothetical protein NITLEN_80161 [Nitrospira lenta]
MSGTIWQPDTVGADGYTVGLRLDGARSRETKARTGEQWFLTPYSVQLTGNLSRGALSGIEQLHGLPLKLGGEPSSLAHVAPPRELSCPHLRCPSNPG